MAVFLSDEHPVAREPGTYSSLDGLSPECEVTSAVCFPGLDERKVPLDGLLHDEVPALEGPALPGVARDLDRSIVAVPDWRSSPVNKRPVGRRGEEGGDSSATSANPLSEGPLNSSSS